MDATAHRRDAWLEIDLEAIRHNVRLIRELVAPARVAPVVKADAYGHGMAAVVGALTDEVDTFCVATLDEALTLQSATTARILLLYPIAPAAARDAIEARIEPTVMSERDLAALASAVPSDAPPTAVHVGVETGMHRGGVPTDELVDVISTIVADRRFTLASLWSHIASPEAPDSARRQVERFETATATLVEAGLPVPARHLAASGGIFTADTPALDLVRPGLAVYGLLDDGLQIAADASAAAGRLQPAMSLKARAVAFSRVAEGESVGYGDSWIAPRPSRVAILPVGYGDGYLRAAQPGAEALVRGRRRPLVGRVSMDAIAVDVTDDPAVDGDDVFVLLGEQGGASITAVELARSRTTIAWEVLSSMAPRLTRVYYPGAGADHPD